MSTQGAICRVRLNPFFYIVAVCVGIKELGIAVKLKADIKEFAVSICPFVAMDLLAPG